MVINVSVSAVLNVCYDVIKSTKPLLLFYKYLVQKGMGISLSMGVELWQWQAFVVDFKLNFVRLFKDILV